MSVSEDLAPALRERLARCRVRVDYPDEDTIFLRRVPTNDRYFSKRHTNLLLRRTPDGLSFIVCVDEDLEYKGDDSELLRRFAGAARQKGWRVLLLGQSTRDLGPAVEDALGALGFDGQQPTIRGGQLLRTFGKSLPGPEEVTAGRAGIVESILASLFEKHSRLTVVCARPGVGKTNLLHAIARGVRERRSDKRMYSVSMGSLLSGQSLDGERERTLATILKEASQPDVILALERIDLAVSEAPHGAFLLRDALDVGARLLGTTVPGPSRKLEGAALEGRLHLMDVPPPEPAEARAMLEAWRPRIAAHHGIEIPEELVDATVTRSVELTGELPGKAVSLLDAGAARAVLAGARSLDRRHLFIAALSLER